MSRFAGRPLDKIWFTFFLMHIPTTLILDLQAIYPPSLLAQWPFNHFSKIMSWYTAFSGDPFLIGAQKGGQEWAWARVLIGLEGAVQLPIFFVGAWCLYSNNKKVYPLLVAYGASTALSVLPVLQVFLFNKTSPALSTFQLTTLLSSYVPFLLIPLTMALDMGTRLIKIIDQAQARKAI